MSDPISLKNLWTSTVRKAPTVNTANLLLQGDISFSGAARLITNNGGNLTVNSTSTGGKVVVSGNSGVDLQNNGVNVLTVASNKVTSSQPVDIAGNLAFTGAAARSIQGASGQTLTVETTGTNSTLVLAGKGTGSVSLRNGSNDILTISSTKVTSRKPIDLCGNVGINTPADSNYKLNILGDTNYLQMVGTNAAYVFNSNSTSGYTAQHLIDNTGYHLQINSTSRSILLDICNTNLATFSNNEISLNKNTKISNSLIIDGLSQTGADIGDYISHIQFGTGRVAHIGKDPSGDKLIFFTTGAGAPDPDQHLILNRTGGPLNTNILGNLAINKTSYPSTTLDVSGNANISGTITEGTQLLSAKYAQISHTHIISDVSGLQLALDDKLSIVGGTMGGSINMNNFNLTNVNGISIADTGYAEGIEWLGGNRWMICETNDVKQNTSGDLQFFRNASSSSSAVRVMSLRNSGELDVSLNIRQKGALLDDTYANIAHTHTTSQITGLDTSLNSLQTQLNGKLNLTGGTLTGELFMGNNRFSGGNITLGNDSTNYQTGWTNNRWMMINHGGYNGNIGSQFPSPEGGILWNSLASDQLLQHQFYMGLTKDTASTATTAYRMDFGSASASSGTTAPTFTSTLTLRPSTQRVGIRNLNPTEALDVDGNIVASGTITEGGTLLSNKYAPYTAFNNTSDLSGNKWYRVAVNGIVDGVNNTSGTRATALFTFMDFVSGRHRTTKFIATCNYGSAPSITLLSNTVYGGGGAFDRIRIVEDTTYEGFAVEIHTIDKLTNIVSNQFRIVIDENYSTNGFTSVAFQEQPNDISGMNEHEIDVNTNIPIFALKTDIDNLTALYNGNIGIGTTNPKGNLHISSSNTVDNGIENFIQISAPVDNTKAQGIYWNWNGSPTDLKWAAVSAVFPGNNNAHLTFSTRLSGTFSEKMRINDNGNVGIGTNNPVAVLHTTGADDRALIYAYRDSGSTETNGIVTGDSGGLIHMFAGSGYGGFKSSAGGGETKLILKNGNVGINKTNPSYALDISGNLNLSGKITIGGVELANSAWVGVTGGISYTGGNVSISGNLRIASSFAGITGLAGIHTYNINNAGGFDYYSAFIGNNFLVNQTTGGLTSISDGSNGFGSGIALDGRHLRFCTYSQPGKTTNTNLTLSEVTRMIILPNGNVGIGTENPTRELHIVGSTPYIRCHSIQNNSGTINHKSLLVGTDGFGAGFWVNNVEGNDGWGRAMTISPSANVGIGNLGTGYTAGHYSNAGSSKTIIYEDANIFNTYKCTLLLCNNKTNPASSTGGEPCGSIGFAGQYTTFGAPFMGLSARLIGETDGAYGGHLHIENADQNGNVNRRFSFFSNGQMQFSLYKSGLLRCDANGIVSIDTSDDRVKYDEQYIEDAITPLKKLKPQTYMKVKEMYDTSGGVFESGLIAQEIYYDVPELRFIVNVPTDASGIEIPPENYPSTDPTVDPDFSNWGSTPASVNYERLIPYLVRAIQQQQEMIDELKLKVHNLENI